MWEEDAFGKIRKYQDLKKEKISLKKTISAALLITAITSILYLPALNNEFVNWDDNSYVYENAHVRSLDLDLLKWSFGLRVLNWHPLTLISHAVDYALWGLNPKGHHLTSIIIHAANTFLLFLLTLKLLSYRGKNEQGQDQQHDEAVMNITAASVTALLFGIHPIHVESVAWVSERKDVLSAFFVLLSIFFYERYISRKTVLTFRNYSLSLAFFLLAVMSKPMAVTVPLVLIILDVYPFRRIDLGKPGLSKRVFLEKIPYLIISLLSALLTLIAQHSGNAIQSFRDYPLFARVLVSMKGLIFYLWKMVFPLNLSPYYPLPRELPSFTFHYLFYGAMVIVITVLCVLAWGRGRRIFMAVWIYYIVTLLPVLGLIQVGDQAAADRYTYLPSIGPFILAGLGVSLVPAGKVRSVCKRAYSAVLIVCVVFLSLLGAKTLDQIKVWKNSITLWDHVSHHYPDLWLAYFNRAHAYTTLGNFRASLNDLDLAIKHNPRYANSFYIRGIDYMGLGQYSKAIKNLDRAIEYDPNFSRAYYMRGSANLKLGNTEEAKRDFEKASRTGNMRAGEMLKE